MVEESNLNYDRIILAGIFHKNGEGGKNMNENVVPNHF